MAIARNCLLQSTEKTSAVPHILGNENDSPSPPRFSESVFQACREHISFSFYFMADVRALRLFSIGPWLCVLPENKVQVWLTFSHIDQLSLDPAITPNAASLSSIIGPVASPPVATPFVQARSLLLKYLFSRGHGACHRLNPLEEVICLENEPQKQGAGSSDAKGAPHSRSES